MILTIPRDEMKDDDPNLVFSGLATKTPEKITWAMAGRVTNPGRYMFKFGWLTITADDLAIWRAYPNATFTLIRALTPPLAEADEEAAGEHFRLGTFDRRIASTYYRFAAFSIAAGLVLAACVGLYFRAEVTSYAARHTVRGDLFEISRVSGRVVWQITQWLSRNLESQVSPVQMSQGKNTQHVEASAPHIAVLQRQAEVDGVGAQGSGATTAKAATLLEPTAIDAEHSQALGAERARGATRESGLAMTRRDVETKAALLSKAADEAAQLRPSAEATAAELRQSLSQERDRVAALLATARARGLETEVEPSRKAGEEAEQLRQPAKPNTGKLEQEQERNRSAALARDPDPAQRVIGARSTSERPGGSQIDPMNQVAEQTAAEPPRTAVKDNPEAARLMARASALLAQGNIGAARIVLERAAETGSAEASFALAETYDPLVLSKWGTYGTRGEATTARELYRKAQAGGIQAANDRLNALRQ